MGEPKDIGGPGTAGAPSPARETWRTHPLIGIGVPTAYLIASAAALAKWGVPIAHDWIFIWLVGLMLAFSVGDMKARGWRIFRDWLPIFAALLAYDLLRGIADGNFLAAHFRAPIEIDKVLGFGEIPTLRLQHALYNAHHLQWYDYVSFGFWFSHFFGTLIAGVAIWLFAYRYFHRFAACIVVLAALGLITYVLFPAAPPWLAADRGVLPPVQRIIEATVAHVPIHRPKALFETGVDYGNKVAAVPSLHAAYTMMITLFLWPKVRRWYWRAALVAYPVGMAFALVYTGEHYLIDILLGWAYAVFTVWIVERLADRRSARAPPSPAPAKA